MNKELFEESFEMITLILSSTKKVLGEKEFNHRKKNICGVYKEIMNGNSIQNSYYSKAHEIRAIEMFINMGDVIVAKDSENEPGVDLVFNDNLIECVTSTAGQGHNYKALTDSGYHVYNRIIDYNEKFRQISLRTLSSLVSKRDKYLRDVKKRVIDRDKPFYIFINLGSLTQEWFPGEFCVEATRFLIGRGHLMIRIDNNTAKQIGGISHSYEPFIINNNDSEVATNFFGDSLNKCVSAVIVSTAEINEKYSPKNTFIFTNPFALSKVEVNDFINYPYWKENKANEYVLRISGEQASIS